MVNGAIITEDEHRRLIEMADCGHRCPGCGICCAVHRDVITVDYFGEEEFEGNLKMGRGGLVKLEGDRWYRVAHCGTSCPGFERCCPPFDLRQRPKTVADARSILLERDDAQRWEMQEALLILAHHGRAEAVEVLETYMRRAHIRLEGFAECALEEGRYFASLPRNAEEARIKMKKEVMLAWEHRGLDAQAEIWEVIEPRLEQLRYEAEIARRLLTKAEEDVAREIWENQVETLEALVRTTEGDLAEHEGVVTICEAMVAEMKADLGMDPDLDLWTELSEIDLF
jgi:hypothetical protein